MDYAIAKHCAEANHGSLSLKLCEIKKVMMPTRGDDVLKKLIKRKKSFGYRHATLMDMMMMMTSAENAFYVKKHKSHYCHPAYSLKSESMIATHGFVQRKIICHWSYVIRKVIGSQIIGSNFQLCILYITEINSHISNAQTALYQNTENKRLSFLL